jgi:hypothetical protein
MVIANTQKKEKWIANSLAGLNLLSTTLTGFQKTRIFKIKY